MLDLHYAYHYAVQAWNSIIALLTMAVDGSYMAMLNETLGNNVQDWDGLGSPPEEQQDTPFYTTPSTQGNKKSRNKNFTAIEGRNQSGKTFENKIMDACVLYKEEDKEKKSFQLLHCWNILRHEPKWHQKMSQMAENKSSQKKNKVVDESILVDYGTPLRAI